MLLRERLLEILAEDIGMGDLTTEAVIPDGVEVEAQIIAKEPLVLAGMLEIKEILDMIGVRVLKSIDDGVEVSEGTVLAEIIGDGRAILTVERTILNILMRMSGIATATRKLLRKLHEANLKVRIAATRKTAPGLRYFDKRAVMIGGGDTHRYRLDDAVLIKDNHIAILGGVGRAVKAARSSVSFTKKIEVEVSSPEEAIIAAENGADIIMLDNMGVDEAKKAIEALEDRGLRKRVLIEISGGITEKNIIDYARLKPDVISIGALTHSVRSVDISLEIKRILN